MRRFLVYAPAFLEAETEAWLDTGFREYRSEQCGDGDGECPDVIFGRLGESDDNLLGDINRLVPKVIVLISDAKVALPVSLQEDFTMYCWHQS